jgi:hypothetical protein
MNDWWSRRVVEFNIFHFSCWAEMKISFQLLAEMKTPFFHPRTFRHSQKSDGVSPTNTSNLLLNLVTKKIRP